MATDPTPLELPYDAVDHVRTDGTKLIAAVVDHGLDRPVASCPGWSLGDLAWHVGCVWSFWGQIVSEGATTIDEVRRIDEQGPARPADDLLLDWVTASHTELLSALVRARQDQEVWTWTGANRTPAWVRRRMAQETAVHRWDAANAAGLPYEVPAAVAADGIDEFLMWFAGRRVAEGAEPVGGSVHLHCTDTDRDVDEGTDRRDRAGGEWLVEHLDGDGAVFTREHAKGDAAVRGRAHDLLMWMWRRSDHGVEIIGDADVAHRFRAFTDLS
jgi:uncharacterized protein (TIGR03083 family)